MGDRILVVEDDASVARTLVRLLTREGAWSVVVATSATEGRRHLADGASRWVGFVVDVGLPEGETAGLELLAHLRVSCPCAPVAVVTGRLEPSIVRAVAELDAAPYVCKPADKAQLAGFLARVAAHHAPSFDPNYIAAQARTRYGFTPREEEVLASELRGEPIASFCEREKISVRTFRAHAAGIIAKARASSLRELAMQLLRERCER